MLYVGLDVHSKSIVICVLGADGKVIQRQCVRQVDQVLAFVERLPKFAVCYEASCGYGSLYDALLKLAARVVVNFRRRLIAKRTRAKNGVWALLRSVCLQSPTRPGLWT